MTALKKLGYFLQYVFRRLLVDGVTYQAASLAYVNLLALVPLAIVMFALFSLIPGAQVAGTHLQSYIAGIFMAQSAQTILSHLHYFADNVHSLSLGSSAFLLVACIFMIYKTARTLDIIWKAHLRRPFWLSLIIYIVVLVATPILIGLAFLLSTYLFAFTFFTKLKMFALLKKPLLFVLPHVLVFVAFTLINWLLPSSKVRIIYAMLAGLVSMVLFELARYGFGLYLALVPTYKLLYGALAVIPIFLVWLYISWLLILLGAVIGNMVVQKRFRQSLTQWRKACAELKQEQLFRVRR